MDREIFDQINQGILSIDPVYFCEKHLTLDGKPFRLNGNGYKPFADIYRYIGIKALERNSKPVVLVKGRQVGATTMAAALEMYFMGSGCFGTKTRPPIRVMHCFPRLDLVYNYSKIKLNAMLSSSIPFEEGRAGRKAKSFMEAKIDASNPSSESQQYKQFEGGNFILLESTGLEGSRIRSHTVDIMFFDEVQDTRFAAIGTAIKSLIKAQYGPPGKGTQVYFGTPKQKGTEYYKIWQASTQQYYQLGCERCGKHFPLYTPESDEWESIWLYEYIVKCTHCGCEQDKRQAAEHGKWVALNSVDDSDYIGYHINCLYMPEFTKEDILKEKPDRSPINTEQTYQNEILGEFYSGDSSPITSDEIDKMCGDHDLKIKYFIPPQVQVKAYLGCDWGGKADPNQNIIGDRNKKFQGKSFSSVVVLLAEGNILNIGYAWLFNKNNLEYKLEKIDDIYRKYRIFLGVGDIGYANDLTEVLQKKYGEKFLASQSLPKINKHVKFIDDIFPQTIQFEKDYVYSEVFSMLKQGNIKFPYGDYEKISWLVEHCCSMNIKPITDRSGGLTTKYVKGVLPNDGFAALVNAYLAYKFDITERFTIYHPNLMRSNPNERKPVLAIAGYAPAMNPMRRVVLGR